MKRAILIIVISACILCFASCGGQVPQDTKSITVCAASSLREVLYEIQPKFEQEAKIKVTFNFASSGALQKQIEEGAPADVFISAGKKQIDALDSENLIDKDSRSNLFGNKLVLVVSDEYKDKIKTTSDLADKDVKISIGEPGSVPAGQYAKESLVYLELWDKLSSKIIYAKDVKQVAAYAEKGEVAVGIVYNSDAAALQNCVIAQVFGEDSHEPIIYPGAIVSASKEKAAAKDFLSYLQSDEAGQIFRKYGFDMNTK